MDEPTLTAFERASRIYCEKIGVDPNVLVPSQDQVIMGVPKLVPQWHYAARDLFDLSLMLTSLKEAATAPVVEVH